MSPRRQYPSREVGRPLRTAASAGRWRTDQSAACTLIRFDALSPIDPFRRGVVEGARKTSSDGSPNFRTCGTQLNRIPGAYSSELVTIPQNQALRDISSTSNLLGAHANPSGSVKLLQKVAEASGLGSSAIAPATGHPGALAADAVCNGAQYAAGNLMNNPPQLWTG